MLRAAAAAAAGGDDDGDDGIGNDQWLCERFEEYIRGLFSSNCPLGFSLLLLCSRYQDPPVLSYAGCAEGKITSRYSDSVLPVVAN